MDVQCIKNKQTHECLWPAFIKMAEVTCPLGIVVFIILLTSATFALFCLCSIEATFLQNNKKCILVNYPQHYPIIPTELYLWMFGCVWVWPVWQYYKSSHFVFKPARWFDFNLERKKCTSYLQKHVKLFYKRRHSTSLSRVIVLLIMSFLEQQVSPVHFKTCAVSIPLQMNSRQHRAGVGIFAGEVFPQKLSSLCEIKGTIFYYLLASQVYWHHTPKYINSQVSHDD